MKYLTPRKMKVHGGRSREGARIEILADQTFAEECDSRSREGARIEISDNVGNVANFWGRSREGARIEISSVSPSTLILI